MVTDQLLHNLTLDINAFRVKAPVVRQVHKPREHEETLVEVRPSTAETDELIEELEPPIPNTLGLNIRPFDVRLIRKSAKPVERIAKDFRLPAYVVSAIKANTMFANAA